MKKIIIFLTIIITVVLANNPQKDKYLEYTNKVINYEFIIKDLDKIESPFYENKKIIFKNITKNERSVKKRVKITLLSIFDNKAYVKIEEFLGEQLIKVNKKWLSKNSKIYDCKLVKLNTTDVVFKCKNKILKKSLNKKIFGLRDKK